MSASAAAPPGFTQGLLASLQPWLTGGSPSALDGAFSQYGGTAGLLSAMLQDSPGAQGAAAFGRALQTNQDEALRRATARQSLAGSGLNLQFMAARMPLMLAAMRQRLGGISGNGAAAQPSAPPPRVSALAPLIASNIGRAAGTGAGVPAPNQPAADPTLGASLVAPPPSPAQASPSGSRAGPSTGGAFGLLNNSVTDSILGLPWANNELSAARAALQYSPAVANAQAVARNKVSQDEAQLYAAYASGNPELIQGLTTRLREDLGQEHVGSMSGIMTQQNPDGSWTTVNPSSGLITNSRTGSSFLPGAIRAFAARAAAEAGGETGARLAAETRPVGSGTGSGGGGTAAGVPGRPIVPVGASPGAGSSGAPAGWDAVQTPGFVPAILSQSGNAPLAPGNTGASELKAFQAGQAKSADATLDELQQKADNAQNIVTQTQEIDAAATQFTPNAYASIRGKLLAALQPTGLLSSADIRALASYQTASKITINLQTALTKTLGSREASQVFDKLGHAVTSVSLSPQGLQMLSGWQKGMARWQIAQNTYAQRLRAQSNVAAINDLQPTFQTHSNPAYYVLASLPGPRRAQLIAESPNPQRLLADWRQAYAQGLAPSPTDFETQ